MSGLTLAIVKRDTGTYSVLRKEIIKTGFFNKKEEVKYTAYPEYHTGGNHITFDSNSIWVFESKRFDSFQLAKEAAIKVFEARNEAMRDASFEEVEEVTAITLIENVLKEIPSQ